MLFQIVYRCRKRWSCKARQDDLRSRIWSKKGFQERQNKAEARQERRTAWRWETERQKLWRFCWTYRFVQRRQLKFNNKKIISANSSTCIVPSEIQASSNERAKARKIRAPNVVAFFSLQKCADKGEELKTYWMKAFRAGPYGDDEHDISSDKHSLQSCRFVYLDCIGAVLNACGMQDIVFWRDY